MSCRHCGAPLDIPLLDLGSAPQSNGYLTARSLREPESWLPLRVQVCGRCWLAQTAEAADAGQLFDGDYAYFSGYSSSWLAHCERYAVQMIAALGLGPESTVVEVAANDGSLLQQFQRRGVRCLGVEPTASTAAAARALGIEIEQAFFGRALAAKLRGEGRQADLMAANNVLAHVPDINDFVAGFAMLLAPDGVATFEFPHLLRMVEGNQFDTVYHEHYSYLSLTAVRSVFAGAGLALLDVEELPTHGGSLRVHAQRADTGTRPVHARVAAMLAAERLAGVDSAAFYDGFQARAEAVKNGLLGFLLEARAAGRRVAGYGAAAKGNTLLNFAGVRADLLPAVVDRNPAKIGKFLPGSRIPVVAEAHLRELRPDYVLVLPWNLRREIVEQLAYVREWGARFVTAVPQLEVD